MLKISLKIALIIFWNLLAFLTIWHILDALFGTEKLWKLLCVAVSLPVFGIIMYFKASTFLQELQEISSHDGKKSSNWK